MDVEALLLPVAPDAPAGPDLSYDPGRQLIEQAFDSPPDEVDWGRTVLMIDAQTEATRDAWLATYLARAGAHAGDLEVVERGCLLLAGLFERFWDTLHPSLDEYGVEGRKGACEALVRVGGFLAPLRRVPLVRHPRLGVFAGADFVRFAEQGSDASGYGQFRAALADTPTDLLDEVADRLDRITLALERADAALSAHAETAGHTGTNFRATYEALDEIARALAPYRGRASEEAEPGGASAIADGAATAVASNGVGRLNGREDVARALDAVIDYYRRAEPTSPIPVALTRIKRWIAMDFLAILDDIAPGSLQEATSVLQARAGDEGSSDLM